MSSIASIPIASQLVAEDRSRPGSVVEVSLICTEQQLASREVEEQTAVVFRSKAQPLWLALKTLLESYFAQWNNLPIDLPVSIARQDYFVREIDALIEDAFKNPLDVNAVLRVTQLGLNARRTIDLCFGLLTAPTAGENDLTILRVDWALGGMADWQEPYHYTFESKLAVEFAPNRSFYSTEKNSKKDITVKQIANIFCAKEHVIEAMEQRALAYIREPFNKGSSGSDAALDFLADE